MDAPALGFAHFLAQTDAVGRFVLAVLALMSLATWYLIIAKGIALWRTRRRSNDFLRMFWNAPNLAAVGAHLRARPARDPFSALAEAAFAAVSQYRASGGARLLEAGSADDFLSRSLRRSLDQTAAELESGLAVLASVGSSAPFVGLFGTVWGIYHALLAIGLAGQGTLDRVAGPVGEALIMTALGLAVAIPAVLAYNGFVRANRMALEALDGFAHELFGFMATGQRAPAAADSSDVPAVEVRTLGASSPTAGR